MKLSYSISKNIFEATVGGILNKLYLHKRRDTLFFGDIFVNYIKECENAGHGEEMKKIAQKWMFLCFKILVPDFLKKLPPIFFLNRIMKRVWINLGLLEDLIATKENNIVKIKTKNEQITKVIGKNDFLPALYAGVLNVLFNSEVKTINISQTKDENKYNEYEFLIENYSYQNFGGKEKSEYIKLNSLPQIKGFMLSDAFKNGIFQLKDNKIYFRGSVLAPEENTVFHLLGNEKILFDRIPEISYNYFKKIVKESSDKEKLVLLKTLLQTMGWGIITIISRENDITIIIKNPPYGLQIEKDNWNFLIQTILGYLWLLDRKLKIKKFEEGYKNLIINFSR